MRFASLTPVRPEPLQPAVVARIEAAAATGSWNEHKPVEVLAKTELVAPNPRQGFMAMLTARAVEVANRFRSTGSRSPEAQRPQAETLDAAPPVPPKRTFKQEQAYQAKLRAQLSDELKGTVTLKGLELAQADGKANFGSVSRRKSQLEKPPRGVAVHPRTLSPQAGGMENGRLGASARDADLPPVPDLPPEYRGMSRSSSFASSERDVQTPPPPYQSAWSSSSGSPKPSTRTSSESVRSQSTAFTDIDSEWSEDEEAVVAAATAVKIQRGARLIDSPAKSSKAVPASGVDAEKQPHTRLDRKELDDMRNMRNSLDRPPRSLSR